MNAHARVVNRVVLALLALALFAVATVASWPLWSGELLPLLRQVSELAESYGVPLRAVAWIIAVGLAIAVILALAIILTRPPRRIHTAVEEDGVTIDASVVEGVFAAALGDHGDVISTSSSTALRRGRRTVGLRVQLRPRADLASVLTRVESALEATDRRLGVRLSLTVQLTGGIRSTFARDRRVE